MAEIPAVARALLETIAGPESAGSYNVIYGGSQFDDFADHPREYVTITSGPNQGQKSSAAGKYQFLASTWDRVAAEAGLTDFSPASQDAAAWYLAQQEYKRDTGRDLLTDLESGEFSQVTPSLRDQWTSMPGGIEQGISGSAFANAYAQNLSSAPQASAVAAIDQAAPTPLMRPAAPPKGGSIFGGAWGALADGISGLKTAALGAMPTLGTSPAVMRAARPGQVTVPPAAIMQALSTVPGRTAIGRYLMNQNIAPAPVMVSGHRSGGTPVMAVSQQGVTPGTLMRPASGRGGDSSRSFDAQVHAGQNMSVYRANRAAVGDRLTKSNIERALSRGATLYRLS